MTKYYRDCEKRSLICQCKALGLEIPERANLRQLRKLYDEYYKEAVVVLTENGMKLRRTNEPVTEYVCDIIIRCSVMVKAVSEEAASLWAEEAQEYLINYDSSSHEVQEAYVDDFEIYFEP